ncbi:MAG: glutathione S-transferase family protein [Pseudomonadota bacterium]
MIRLLGRKTSGNVQKVLFLLEELGLGYEREDYGRQFENTQTDAYLAMNPNAKVPTLVDGDLVVWESNTILRYLAAKAGSALYPADPAIRTHIERWMDWQLASLNGPYLAVFKGSRLEPSERGAGFEASGKDLAAQLAILDGALANRDWLAGDAVSLAEYCLGPIIQRCLNFPVDLPALDHLRMWHQRVAALPAFSRAVPT